MATTRSRTPSTTRLAGPRGGSRAGSALVALLGASLVLCGCAPLPGSDAVGARAERIAASDRIPASPAEARDAADAAEVPLAVADSLRGASHATSNRRQVRCAGCGIVESARSSDPGRRPGACADDALAHLLTANASLDGAGGRFPPLQPAAATTSARPGFARTARNHEIIVRFRDGSRQVFSESTARDMRSGERVLIIAGADGGRPD